MRQQNTPKERITDKYTHRYILQLNYETRGSLSSCNSGLLALRPATLGGASLRLLGQKHCLNVGENSALSNGHTGQQLVKFFVITDGELQMPRDYSGLLVVSGSVTSQLQHFGSQVLHDRSKIHRSASSYSLCVLPFTEQPVDSSDGELEAGSAGSRFDHPLTLSSFAATGHSELFSCRSELSFKA